jgi:hypothetical protein
MEAGLFIASVAILAAAGGGARPAYETRGKAPISVIREVARCRPLTEAAERLACFDRATAALLAAEEKADIIIVDRQQVEASRRSGFGFGPQDVTLLRQHGAQIAPLDRIDGILAVAISDAGGQWTFELRDGAVWQQIDTNTLSRLPSAGQAVAIKRASLGSYLLAVGKDVAVRVRRVR